MTGSSPDTQEAAFEFPGGKTIIWEGQSCKRPQTRTAARAVPPSSAPPEAW